MALAAGDKLGPYEIIAPIGAGGMGEVYRARDSRLGRQVAIKVARERFSDRFEWEARAIATLNHPHTCETGLFYRPPSRCSISFAPFGARCERR
jgi:serine/threonine-protein kinase